MNRKQKITLVAAFAAALVIIAGLAFFFTGKNVQEGSKKFQIEVVSERDSFYKISDGASDLEYLGEYLRTTKDCQWEESDYGIFITGWYDKKQDADNGYWWIVTVNDKEAATGADEIPLQDGDKYTFTLTKF